jgi:hypothetical protein
LAERCLSQIPPIFRHGRGRGHPRKLQLYGLLREIKLGPLAQLNSTIEFASVSVDGRVRGHDDKGVIVQTAVQILRFEIVRFFVLRITCVHAVALT